MVGQVSRMRFSVTIIDRQYSGDSFIFNGGPSTPVSGLEKTSLKFKKECLSTSLQLVERFSTCRPCTCGISRREITGTIIKGNTRDTRTFCYVKITRYFITYWDMYLISFRIDLHFFLLSVFNMMKEQMEKGEYREFKLGRK